MARTRDEHKFKACRESLLEVGRDLFINSSFNSVGLNDILRQAGIPKGSFYHYFSSKEDFGLQVVERYASENLQQLEARLADDSLSRYEQLKGFFSESAQHFEDIEYCQGCLMANLSQELADVNENLRCKISELSRAMLDRLAQSLAEMDAAELNLGHLDAEEAAQVLLNSWQGAVMKMKLEKSREPLDVFMKFFFSR